MVPAGRTEFRFPLANLCFESTGYQWLVVTGDLAQYRGSGMINGEGDFGFLVTAAEQNIRDRRDLDKFRIKIWNRTTGGLIYDNALGASDDIDEANPPPIAAGNINIHRGRGIR